jgi:hypothetical protein
MQQYTPAELMEFFNERAGIREFDGVTTLQLVLMSEDERVKHRRAAEQAAYWDLKKLVGNCELPPEIIEMARKFK